MNLSKKSEYIIPSESDEQMTLFEWCEIYKAKYPELKLLFHIPNGGKRYKSTAIRLKKEGVKSGIPDLMLPVPTISYHGLFIEMKSTDKYANVSKSQEEWINLLSLNGYKAIVCHGWQQATKEILNYLNY